METKLIFSGVLCAMLSACSSEDDLHWLPADGYAKPAPVAADTVGTVTSIDDLAGTYDATIVADGNASSAVVTMTRKPASDNMFLMTGFMGRPDALDIRVDMEANKVYVESETWYDQHTILSDPLTAELYAVGTFDNHAVITLNKWNVYDVSAFTPQYQKPCSATLKKKW